MGLRFYSVLALHWFQVHEVRSSLVFLHQFIYVVSSWTVRQLATAKPYHTSCARPDLGVQLNYFSSLLAGAAFNCPVIYPVSRLADDGRILDGTARCIAWKETFLLSPSEHTHPLGERMQICCSVRTHVCQTPVFVAVLATTINNGLLVCLPGPPNRTLHAI